MSRDQLAQLSGLGSEVLRELEEGGRGYIAYGELQKIVSHLKLQNQREFRVLMEQNRPPAFTLLNVGIARTGTTSIGHIFNSYRSHHEIGFKHIAPAIQQFSGKEISRESFEGIVLGEYGKHAPWEVVSASYSHYYLDVLLRTYPEAKYLVTLRDCFGWVESISNFVVGRNWKHGWLYEYTWFNAGVPPEVLANEKAFLKNHRQYLENFFRLWGEWNGKILGMLPRERLLVLRTHEISQKREEIAAFVGVSPESLNWKRSHRNQNSHRLKLAEMISETELEALFAKYAAPIMREYFPEMTIGSFLAASLSPPRQTKRQDSCESYPCPTR